MSRVDGTAAAQTLLGFGTWRAGYCLEAVWTAYKRNGASTGHGAVPTAYAAWLASIGKHEGDRNPPAGVPVWWGPRSWGSNPSAGDVTISLGGGRVAATDWPRSGVIGSCTIDEREAQIGRPYLGWTEAIFDQLIAYPAPAGGSTEEENELNDSERNMLTNIYNAIFYGGPSLADGGRAMGQSLADLAAGGRAVVWRTVNGVNTPIHWLQELADTKTLALELVGRPAGAGTVDVDEAELAGQVAVQLAPLLADHLTGLSDEDVAKLAAAAADETDRRARERLK